MDVGWLVDMTGDRKDTVHRCPECGKIISWKGNRYRPFCSSRCKHVDLGKWLREEYSLPVDDIMDIIEEHTQGK